MVYTTRYESTRIHIHTHNSSTRTHSHIIHMYVHIYTHMHTRTRMYARTHARTHRYDGTDVGVEHWSAVLRNEHCQKVQSVNLHV